MKSKESLERTEQMQAMKLDGETYQAIGERFGVSRQRVQQILEPPTQIRNTVIRRAKGRCEECGILTGSIGHVHHVSHGDLDYSDIDNLRFLCPTCHRLKHLAVRYSYKGKNDGTEMCVEVRREGEKWVASWRYGERFGIATSRIGVRQAEKNALRQAYPKGGYGVQRLTRFYRY